MTCHFSGGLIDRNNRKEKRKEKNPDEKRHGTAVGTRPGEDNAQSWCVTDTNTSATMIKVGYVQRNRKEEIKRWTAEDEPKLGQMKGSEKTIGDGKDRRSQKGDCLWREKERGSEKAMIKTK